MTTTVTRCTSTRRFTALSSSVGLARDQIATAVHKWRLPVSLDDAVLVVSELVTNAIRMSRPTDQVILHLRWISIGLVIGVWDSSTTMPTVGALGDLTLDDIVPDPEALGPDDDRTGGWGLPLVQMVAGAFQVERTASPIGKWVIALLPTIVTGMKNQGGGVANVSFGLQSELGEQALQTIRCMEVGACPESVAEELDSAW
ncbi:ATP-binding protein [Actinomadura macra]|uniref:ATP-binding protein n=1 Tax=Actinomadura macra TaxID=46164 RepID=UPI00082E2308|nr:ATP-binding protein [Actinomadura macra]